MMGYISCVAMTLNDLSIRRDKYVDRIAIELSDLSRGRESNMGHVAMELTNPSLAMARYVGCNVSYKALELEHDQYLCYLLYHENAKLPTHKLNHQHILQPCTGTFTKMLGIVCAGAIERLL